MATLTSGSQFVDLAPPGARRLPGIDGNGGVGPSDGNFLGYIIKGTLLVQHTATGITPVFQAATGAGDQYANTGRETLWVHNNSGAPITVTVKAQSVCNVAPGFLHDIVTVVAAAGEASIGPAAFNVYNDPNGQVQIFYSTAIGVTVALTAG